MFLTLLKYYFICNAAVAMLTFRNGEACFHPDKSLHTIATMSNAAKEGVYPVNTTIAYHCDPGYEIFYNESRRCTDNGSWSGREAYCGLNVFTPKYVWSVGLGVEYKNSTFEGRDLESFYRQCLPIDNSSSTTWNIQLNNDYKIDTVTLAFEHDYDVHLSTYHEDSVDQPKVRYFSSEDINSSNSTYNDMKLVLTRNTSETRKTHTFSVFQYAVDSPSQSNFVSLEIDWSKRYFMLCNISLYTNSVALQNPCDSDNDTSKHVLYDGKCYVLFSSVREWSESTDFCQKNRRHKSTLASFSKSDEIFKLIESAINGTKFASLEFRIKNERITFHPYSSQTWLNTWWGPLATICVYDVPKDILTCGTPDQKNETLMVYAPETNATYSCPKDFELVGNASRQCISGRWSSEAPTCTRVNVTTNASNNCQSEGNLTSCLDHEEKTMEYIKKTTIIVVAVTVIVQWLVTGSIFVYLKHRIR